MLEMENVMIEGDSKIIVDDIVSGSSGVSTFYDYVDSCRQNIIYVQCFLLFLLEEIPIK